MQKQSPPNKTQRQQHQHHTETFKLKDSLLRFEPDPVDIANSLLGILDPTTNTTTPPTDIYDRPG